MLIRTIINMEPIYLKHTIQANGFELYLLGQNPDVMVRTCGYGALVGDSGLSPACSDL